MAERELQRKDHQRTILVADDEIRLARAVSIMLDSEGLQTVVVHDGESALRSACELRPDLIVMDVTMPGRSGIEVCATLKTHADTKAIPIVLVTARAEKADRMVGEAAGADGYLTKPFSPTELINLVNQLLAGRPAEPWPSRAELPDMSADQLTIYAQELKDLVEKERQQREELEQAHLRLDELDRLKGAFLGAVTHELLTPFVGVGLPLEVLQQRTENLSPEQVEALDKLAAAIAVLHRRVNGIVKFAELVSKRRKPQPGRISLHRVVPWAVESAAVLARGRNIDLRVFVPPDLPKVRADPELVGEAVFQIAHNAVKFSQPGGWARIQAFQLDASWAVVEVADGGAGLTKEQLALLEQPFDLSAEGLRHGQGGLGIGWTFVRYVAEAHEGWVHVESAGRDQGSVFSLALPLAMEQDDSE